MDEEFDSFINILGPVATAGYKFFSAFKIKDDVIEFYKDFKATASFDVLKELRSYIKAEKLRCTEEKKSSSVSSVRQRVIFFLIKLNEHGIFSLNDRKYLLFYWQTLDDLCI